MSFSDQSSTVVASTLQLPAIFLVRKNSLHLWLQHLMESTQLKEKTRQEGQKSTTTGYVRNSNYKKDNNSFLQTNWTKF